MNKNNLKSKILKELVVDKYESKFIRKYNHSIKEVKEDIRNIRINRIKSFFRNICNYILIFRRYKIKVVREG